MLRTPVLVVIAFVAGFLSAPVHADLDGDRFKSEQWRVNLKGPKGWQLSEQSSYPSVLLWMSHRRPDARMLFSAEAVEVKDAQSYAAETVQRLEKLGYQIRTPQLHSTGAYWMDFDDGSHFLRQALLVRGDIGYALTLSTPDPKTRGQLLRAFDYSLRSIVLVRNKAPDSAR